MPRGEWAKALYPVAERFRDDCLVADGSLFVPGRTVWTTETIADFTERFVEDLSSASFDEKLQRQLDGASPDTALLAAEVYFINLFAESDSGKAIKRRHVEVALASAGVHVEFSPELDAAFSKGLATLAQARNQRDRQFRFILELGAQLKQRSVEERRKIVRDPSAFRELEFSIPRSGAGYQLEAFLHLFFPDAYEPIVSADAKQQIARAFASYIGAHSGNVDEQIAAIREQLIDEYGEDFGFYDDDVRARWDTGGSRSERAWIVRGERAYDTNLVPRWLEQGFASMGRVEEGHVQPGMEVREIIDLVQSNLPELTRQQLVGGCTSGRRFATDMSIGDYVMTRDGEQVYFGRVTSDQEWFPDGEPGTARRRTVNWTTPEPPLTWAELPKSLRDRATNPNTVWELKGQEKTIGGLLSSEPDLWEPFLYWAQRLYEHESFNPEERDYKLVVAENALAARRALEDGDPDWLERLRRAFGSPNNLTSHFAHGPFLDWSGEEPQSAAAFLRRVWSKSALDPAALDEVADTWPVTQTSPGNRLSILCLLFMAVDPFNNPPFRATPVERAMRLLGISTPSGETFNADADYRPEDVARLLGVNGRRVRDYLRGVFPRPAEAKGSSWPPLTSEQLDVVFARFGRPPLRGVDDTARRYTAFIELLDELVERMAARNTPVRDRLDAQGLMWWVTSAAPPDDWSEADKAVFLSYQRGDGGDGNGGGEVEESDLRVLARQLLLKPESWLEEVVRLLERKRQVIFYGPPGTGKTYVAQKLALHLAGSADRVRIVQFHPSYAYEDFVEGYRPTLEDGIAGFRLHNGPLRQLAEDARNNPDQLHVLLIDEINRGNVAKVFGELYFLLEYRDHTLRLQYSDAPFSLPDNLLVIGTMNTADRTIALIDTALRRRFHFVPFFPTRPPIDGLLHRWLEREGPELLWLVDVVDAANRALEDEHAAIGPSYFMVDGLDEEWVETIWRHSIVPMIEERYFTEPHKVSAFELGVLRGISKPEEDTEEEDAEAGDA